MSQKYTIIFRTCDSVNAVNKKPRPFDLPKAQLIKICFLSLLEALQGFDFRITILGDKLSQEMIDFFKTFNVKMILGSYGNDASIRESFTIARSVDNDEWVYFCEDDYLHSPSAFTVIDHFLNQRDELLVQKRKLYNASSFINLKRKDLFVFPPDYPDRYFPKFRKHSLILLSQDCHWRQVSNVTFTFLTKSSSIKKHFKLLMKSSERANDGLLSRKLFGRFGFGFLTDAVCFSPLPGLSTHMHQDTMTPLVNWEKLTLMYKNKIQEYRPSE